MCRSGKKDEYDIIYDFDGLDIEEKIEDLRGNIGRGTCLYCGAENGMKFVRIKYIALYRKEECIWI